MDMPTPCPECGEIVEFTMMQNVDGTLLCDDCAAEYECDACSCFSKEVHATEYGHLCNACYQNEYDEECMEQDFEE